MESISQLIGSLNAEQRQAVMHVHGPQLVLAGAGTGKTRVITTRIAYLISKGIDPKSILAVSFTRKAGTEMKARLFELAGEQAKEVHVSTFHALGLSILREQPAAVGLRRSFKVCSEEQQTDWFEYIWNHLEPSLIDETTIEDTVDLKRRVLNAKTSGHCPASLREEGHGGSYEYLIAGCMEQYNDLLREGNLIDIDDMIALPAQMLESEPELRAVYQNRFSYLMVDEYQDTNQSQHRLTCSLLSSRQNLCVVGDDDQSIYTFRGANRELILKFPQQFPTAAVVKLTKNYRCSSQIIEVANKVIDGGTTRHKKTLVSANGPSCPVRFVDTSNSDMEHNFILDEIKRSRRPLSEIAVLCRGGKDVREMKLTLQQSGLPLSGKQPGIHVMTLHASKGLEFPVVFLTGVQESNLPHWNAINDGPNAIEEERRLFYVGVTRAKEELTLSAIQSRGRFTCERSRFATELLELRNVTHTSLAN